MRFGKEGMKTVRASKAGYRKGTARVRVLPSLIRRRGNR
jgi:hypothetical protein